MLEVKEILESDSMDTMQVNWEALDALVIDFAKSEQLIADSSAPSSSSSSSYRWRRLICQIRHSIESGNIDSAIDLLRLHAPVVLDDRRLLFCLQKQKFIELLRKGTDGDRDSAINYARTSLATCALDAYPEAYEEFKHVLLAFIYDKDDQMSPVVNEWCTKRRYEIAGRLSSVLRSHLHAYDPIFSMTLKYLISIHKGFCLRQGASSPISNLTERLLLEERDPPPVLQESSFEVPPFDEVDIQALAHAVELTRQGAVDSLKFAKGDLYKAFQNELCRIRIDVSVLDELVHEYCIFRGILDILHPQEVDQLNQHMSPNSTFASENELSANSAHVEGFQINTDPISDQHAEMEVRYLSDAPALSEDCSTSRTCQSADSKVVHRYRNPVAGERGKRKRWRGRDRDQEASSEVVSGTCIHEYNSNACSTCGNMSPLIHNLSQKLDKFEIVLGLNELTRKGMTAKVYEEINSLDPKFFVLNPLLHFQLKQAEFLKHVNAGDQASALKVASSHLGPLAAKDPAFLKPLKETLLVFLKPIEEPISKNLSIDALATSLQVAVGQRLGIEEPHLMKIIRATLRTHTEWFKLQMCKDQFEGLLWISSLKQPGSPLIGDALSNSPNDTCTQGSSLVTMSSSNMRIPENGNTKQTSSADIGCDENAILKVMEFLALPRADAIHLLAQYNGNAETVIQQIFA